MSRWTVLRVMLAGAVILALLAQSALYGEESCNEFIVKTQDAQALHNFAPDHDLELRPLITYPNPSAKVLERFGCYWLASAQDSERTENLLHRLEGLPGVERVEPNLLQHIEFPESRSDATPILPDTFHHPYTPNDPMFPQQWDKIITETDWAWNLTTAEGVVIAILDTGADTDHEDLQANLVPGYNFVDDTSDIEDDYGHGTHVSGIAAAKIDNSKGIAGIAGNASIMPLKVADSGGNYTNADLAQGIIYAADNGADVVNMSLGGTHSQVLEDAVNYAWEAGAFLCAAAGNKREERSDYPAAYEHVASVGATTSGDSRWQFSNYGESVAIFAPGGGYEGILSTERGGYYGWRDGTSMACPQVAGLAALIASVYPEYTNQDVWEKMIASADTIPFSHELRINSRVALDVVEVAEDRGNSLKIRCAEIQKGRISFAYRVSELRSYTLRIFNAAGREVYSTGGEIPPGGRIECDAGVSSGVYFWELRTAVGAGSGKFIYLH
ncbi:MAG: peptidase S8 [Candidatus Stahlbacteria bacterium]|nr:MAG: peptidase S8 [Candidatus Stahlbacteria bacterium]